MPQVAAYHAVSLGDGLAAQNDVLRAQHLRIPQGFVAHVRFDVFALGLFWWHVAAALTLVLVALVVLVLETER